MWAVVCAALTIVSCTPDTPGDDPQGPTYTSAITVSGAPEANLAPEAGELSLSYAIENPTLTDALVVTTEATWVKTDVTETAVILTYEANTDAPGMEPRKAVIKFSYNGAEDKFVTLTQNTEAAVFAMEYSNVTCNTANYVCTPADGEMLYFMQNVAELPTQGETPLEKMQSLLPLLLENNMIQAEPDYWYTFKGSNAEMPGEAYRFSAEQEFEIYVVGIKITETVEMEGMVFATAAELATPVHVFKVPFLPYPSLTIAEADLTKNVTSAAGEVVINCAIENPIEGSEVYVQTEAAWVTPSYADGKLTLAYEANTTAVARRAVVSVGYGDYVRPVELTLVQEKDANAVAITLNIEVVGTQFNGIIVNVTPSDKNVTYALNHTTPEKDWETDAELPIDWMGKAENLLSYVGNETFHNGDLTNYLIKTNVGNYKYDGYDYYVYAIPVEATSEETTDYWGNPKTEWTVSQILGEAAVSEKVTIDVSKMPKLEWDLTKNPELVLNSTNNRYDLEVVEGSTVVLHYILTNPVEGASVKLNGKILDDSNNVVDGEPVIDNAAGTITFNIDKFDTTKSYHYVQPGFKYTNETDDMWGVMLPSLRLTQVQAPAYISSVAALTAGNYYVAGKLAEYNNNGSMKYWTEYPYHFWTGAVSAPGNTSSNSDLLTVNGNEAMELDPNMAAQDAAKGQPGVVTLVAVDGKANTYYVKVGEQYLYCAVAGTNRRMQLGSEPVEWVFADHSKGGIDLASNGVHLATAGATYNLIRNYKDSSAGTSHQYGLVFFPVAE